MSLNTSDYNKSKFKNSKINIDTKLSLLMKSLTEFYKTPKYINQIKSIIDQENKLSLRILDWFITNYAKKHRTIINVKENSLDIYQNYKLQLKSFSKSHFDPFCRKNKILFYYDEVNYIETSCGQLCFFRWCFENGILDFVKENFNIIEKDMKKSLKIKKSTSSETSSESSSLKKRQPLSISASRSVSRQNIKYTISFD
jgi:hypothetical protein